LLARLLADFPSDAAPCPVGSDRALDYALVTARDAWDPELVKKLDAIMGRVLAKA
jgi:5'-methylthioadenosine phosphorylase